MNLHEAGGAPHRRSYQGPERRLEYRLRLGDPKEGRALGILAGKAGRRPPKDLHCSAKVAAVVTSSQ
jgi:hypothetical protein